MIRHVILYKFGSSIPEEQRRRAIMMLRSLGQSIPEIREWSIGEQSLPSSKAYDLAQVSSFESIEAFERYRHHPEHIRVRDFLSKLADWVVVDYEINIE